MLLGRDEPGEDAGVVELDQAVVVVLDDARRVVVVVVDPLPPALVVDEEDAVVVVVVESDSDSESSPLLLPLVVPEVTLLAVDPWFATHWLRLCATLLRLATRRCSWLGRARAAERERATAHTARIRTIWHVHQSELVRL